MDDNGVTNSFVSVKTYNIFNNNSNYSKFFDVFKKFKDDKLPLVDEVISLYTQKKDILDSTCGHCL